MSREVKAIESLMKKKPRSSQCGAKLLTSIDRIIIWCLLANDTIASENGSILAASVFPIAHPFPVSPAIGAKQGDALSA